MSTKDGGSAFPEIFTDTVGQGGEYRQDTYSAGGMSLRDYFAAKAMQGEVAGLLPGATLLNLNATEIAAAAYRIADAMLAARDAAGNAG